MFFWLDSQSNMASNAEDLDLLSIKEDGILEDTFSYEDAIKEEIYVDTGIDSDDDGKSDRVYVEITRPKEADAEMRIPVIYNMSSYNGGLPYPEYHDVNEELYDGKPIAAPTLDDHYAPYFVPKGYAVVTANNIGTEGSDGCPSTGGKDEIQASKAVIDWLNGNAEAFDEDGNEVDADWSTGNVGMIGKSYDGTLANGVATTGVEGLKTIVPIAAISNWYDYYRKNGAVIAPGGYPGDDADRLARGVLTRENPEVCEPLMDEIEEQQDRKTGNYNQFWDERNYLNQADQIEASVFLIHGLNDFNVQLSQSTNLWEKLKQNDVPRKMWMHQGEHDDPLEVRGEKWLTQLNKWFAYWLYDIDNGIMDEPIVNYEYPNHKWEQLEEWPRNDVDDKTLYLSSSDDDNDTGLRLEKESESDNDGETFIDDASIEVEDLIKKPFEKSENRVTYVSSILDETMNLSGIPELSIKAEIDEPTANLSAVLVDYGDDENKVVTRGWIDPKNKGSLSKNNDIKPGKPYTFTWDMESYEYEFKKGHRLGLVIISSDHEYTKRPGSGTKITIYPNESEITLPLTGQLPGETIVEEKTNEQQIVSNQIWKYGLPLGGVLIVVFIFGIVKSRKKEKVDEMNERSRI